MSLRVWLPLTGHLNNQGLDDITITNNGATIDNSGKLGKCYSFDGTQYLKGTLDPSTWTEFSLAFWTKFPEPTSGNKQILAIGTSSGWGNIRAGVLYRASAKQIMFSISNGSNYVGYNFSISITTAVWQHVVATYKNNVMSLYLNGVSQGTYTTTFAPNFSGITSFGVGAASNGAEKYIGQLNDVRIYDHALSPKEIKLLSQGLVCHYKLDDPAVQTMDNCYVYPTFDTSSSNGGWYHWGRTGHAGSYSQNTDPKFIFTPGQTYSHCVSNAATATGEYLCYQSPEFDGGYRSLCCIIKESNSLPITEDIAFPDWNANVSSGAPLHKWTSIISIGNGFYLCKVEGLQQSGSNDLVGIYVCPGYTIYITCAYLENNRTVCSDIFYNTDIVYDCSGFGHTGIISGELTTSSDTPRNSISTTFDTSQHINTTITPTGYANSYTFAWWGKFGKCNGTMMWGFANGNRLNLYCYTYNCYWNTGNGQNNPFGVALSDYLDDKFHHFAVTGDGTTTKLYIDGEFKGNATTYQGITGTNLYFNGWAASSSYNFNGSLSDFRLYATALSAEDIQQLYNAPVSVSNNGAMFTQGEFIES